MSLKTDVFDTAIGAALEQLEGNVWGPVSFFSRKLSPTVKNYSTYDRKFISVFASTLSIKHILEGRAVIQTDHKPLIYAFAQLASKLFPCQLRLSKPGADNSVADALSRIYPISLPNDLDAQAIFEAIQAETELRKLEYIFGTPDTAH